MTNIFSPFGFQQVQRYDGGSPTMGLTKVLLASSDTTPIFSGDLVQNLPAESVVSGGFGEYVTQASSGLTTNAAYRGVFFGCEYLNTVVGRPVWTPYWPGGGSGVTGDAIAWICDDPSMLYIAQCSTTALLGSSNVGMNVTNNNSSGVATTSSMGNTFSGISGGSVNPGSAAATATFPFRIRDFYSNWAAGAGSGAGALAMLGGGAAGAGFVNGTDNTNPGQVLVLQPNNFTLKNTTGV